MYSGSLPVWREGERALPSFLHSLPFLTLPDSQPLLGVTSGSLHFKELPSRVTGCTLFSGRLGEVEYSHHHESEISDAFRDQESNRGSGRIVDRARDPCRLLVKTWYKGWKAGALTCRLSWL